MRRSTAAYLDIETTGLGRFVDYITVIGIYRCDGGNTRLIQLVGEAVTGDKLFRAV